MEFKHKSVLLEETIDGLNVKADGIYVDGTLGGAGPAMVVCNKLSARGRFIGKDRDRRRSFAAIIVTWYRNWQQGGFIRSMGFFWTWEYLPTS